MVNNKQENSFALVKEEWVQQKVGKFRANKKEYQLDASVSWKKSQNKRTAVKERRDNSKSAERASKSEEQMVLPFGFSDPPKKSWKQGK